MCLELCSSVRFKPWPWLHMVRKSVNATFMVLTESRAQHIFEGSLKGLSHLPKQEKWCKVVNLTVTDKRWVLRIDTLKGRYDQSVALLWHHECWPCSLRSVGWHQVQFILVLNELVQVNVVHVHLCLHYKFRMFKFLLYLNLALVGIVLL